MNTRVEWNHAPAGPIEVSPLWQWPPRPLAVARWYVDAWFPLSINLAITALAFVVWFWFSPTLAQAETLWFWPLGIWLRNAVIVTLLAGGLHWWFHGAAAQGTQLKYDPRPFPRQGRMFSFASQLKDNIFWTIASGVTVWSLFEALGWWGLANGWLTLTTFAETPVWFVAFFFLVPVWDSFYFYWIHRLLHTDMLYRFHALHHRNTDIGPWSGLSMHPVEHVMYFGTVLIHLVLPSSPVHVIFHLMFYALFAITTHTGFEGLWFRGKKRMQLGTFHHQIHHRYFEVNYGNLDVPWDKLFGSWHDGTESGKARMRERLKNRTKR